jgi:hypothetical protein
VRPERASASTSRPSLQKSRGFFLASNHKEDAMHPDDEIILRMTKEIVVKFIELQRVSPTNFEEHFKRVYWTLKNIVVEGRIQDLKSEILGDNESKD